jgi:hypothetical protein
MNVQHSQRTDEWGTPESLVVLSRLVLGQIDLDPASDAHFNRVVGASCFFTKEDDALSRPWSCSTPPDEGVAVFLNPPGGKTRNKSNVVLFWQKLLDEVEARNVSHAIFMGFSVECLQTTQQCTKSVAEFPICIPNKRVKFCSKNGTYDAPSHSNVIAYVPGTVDKTYTFMSAFKSVGVCKW